MKAFIWIILLCFITVNLSARSIYKVENNSVIIDVEGMGKKSELLKIEFWTTSTVKVVTGMKNDGFSSQPSLISNDSILPVKFKVAYSGTNVEIVTKDLVINVEENGLIRFFNRDGSKLLLESERAFTPSTLENGAFAIKQRFFLNMNEHIFGFGQREGDMLLGLRNAKFEMKQTLSEIASPIFYSEKGYAIIWDNYSPTTFSDTKGGLEINSQVADEVQYFLIYGPEWDKITSEIRTLTGQAPMLPRWAYGFWFSPDATGDENAMNATLEKCHSLGIPVDKYADPNYGLLHQEEKVLKDSIAPRFANAKIPQAMEPIYKQLKDSATSRLCFPSHCGFPGIQKYGTYTYAGDISGCWETLKNQPRAGINMGFAGQPYWSTNIGGVATQGCTNTPADELLVRWYQFAAFNPIFQVAQPGKEPWTVGSAGDPKFEAIKKAIILRYELLPYIYSLANKVETENSSIMCSMLYDEYKDEKLHTANLEYLFGNSLLIRPIGTPGISSIKVTIPAKNNWYDFWTGEKLTAGQEIEAKVTLNHLPVYVREGSILPIAQVFSTSTDSLNAPMEIRVYPGANGEFTLYEDENNGLGYKNGNFSKIRFSYTEKDKTLEIDAIEGIYPGMPTERQFNVVLVTPETGIGTSYASQPKKVEYKGKKIKVKL
jgi:alpha-glucosidase (family GH31 glycosyl hydrolase)